MIQTLDEKLRAVDTEVLQAWHPIDGIWRHIAQLHSDGQSSYFTDGVREVEYSARPEQGKFYVDEERWREKE